MTRPDGPVILLAKKDAFSRSAAAVAQVAFRDRIQIILGKVGDELPPLLANERPAMLLSFLSPWIIPKRVLDECDLALNFHPGSVEYPGIGCYNFALYEEAPEFGAVCHEMLPKVDTGSIVEERRFPLFPSDSVETLKLRTMVTMSAMFHDIVCLLATAQPLPRSGAGWTRRPYTRRDLEALKLLDTKMDVEEVARRVRAVTYPGYPGAVMVEGDRRTELPVPKRRPIA